MLFVWDPHKAERNIKKHGVSFELAQTVFDDPLHKSILDQKRAHEERWVTIGCCATEKTLVVVHTYAFFEKNEIVRIISARRATKKEQNQYEKGI